VKLTIVILLIAPLAAAQGRPPKLLTDALRRLPGLTILDPAIDLRQPVNQEEANASRERHDRSWVKQDFDHDSVADIVVVVTERVDGRTRFGVLAVLAKNPGQVSWIEPLRADPIYGVKVWRERVFPIVCIACDYFPWYRWSGRAFVSSLPSASDALGVVIHDILVAPSEGAGVVAKSGTCQRVKVIDFREPWLDTRWYLVETLGRKHQRGWVPAQAVYNWWKGMCITEQ
jgi:hypothetical protein